MLAATTSQPAGCRICAVRWPMRTIRVSDFMYGSTGEASGGRQVDLTPPDASRTPSPTRLVGSSEGSAFLSETGQNDFSVGIPPMVRHDFVLLTTSFQTPNFPSGILVFICRAFRVSMPGASCMSLPGLVSPLDTSRPLPAGALSARGPLLPTGSGAGRRRSLPVSTLDGPSSSWTH